MSPKKFKTRNSCRGSIIKGIGLILMASSFFVSSSHALPPTDFTRDGISDLTQVRIENDGSLSWFVASPQSGGVVELGSFGKLGDHLAVAPWFTVGVPTIAFKRLTDEGVRWVASSADVDKSRFILGTAEHELLSGGDFNGNGIGDAVAVRPDGNSLLWTVASDPFVNQGTVLQEIKFGRSKDVPFFLRRDAATDVLAIFRARSNSFRVSFRSTANPKAQTIQLKGLRSGRYEPFPLQGKSGGDFIALVSRRRDGRRIFIYNARGERKRVIRTAETGTLVVGDFLTSPGEEVAIQKADGTSFEILSPWTGLSSTVTSAQGIPVDEINFNSFSSTSPRGDKGDNGDSGSGGGAPRCPVVSTPGQCASAEARDGNEGFLWKPNSDTMFYAVMLLPNTYTGCTAKVETVTRSGVVINELSKKVGTPNGGREAFQDFKFTGKDYRNTYGQIIVRATMKNGSCLDYLIESPASRTD